MGLTGTVHPYDSDNYEVLEFRKNLEENALDLRDRLRRMDIPLAKYRSFFVFDPKVRKVIYTDYVTKIIQRSMYNVLYGPVQKGFIPDSYACVTDKGQHKAVAKLASWFSEYNSAGIKAYYYKFDVRRFFYRIDHDVLMNDIIEEENLGQIHRGTDTVLYVQHTETVRDAFVR